MPRPWVTDLCDDRILITGAAGFVGHAVARALLAEGVTVVGVDTLNDYYDPALKQARLDTLTDRAGFTFHRLSIADRPAMDALFAEVRPTIVLNLAAQPGVRYALENPHAYADANVTGFLTVLEACRAHPVRHLVYASSSSVYGGNTTLPFRVRDSVDHPVSLYAATKKANELMAHSYSHLFGIPATGLRFFTVYGPWGRPDMAVYLFTRALFAGTPIRIFNHGEMWRDFTYIDDIVGGVVRLLSQPPVPNPAFDRSVPDPGSSWAPHRVFNIGNARTEKLLDMIGHLEALTGRTANRVYVEMQPGDVERTEADVSALEALTGFRPNTRLRDGLARFVDWYRGYHDV